MTSVVDWAQFKEPILVCACETSGGSWSQPRYVSLVTFARVIEASDLGRTISDLGSENIGFHIFRLDDPVALSRLLVAGSLMTTSRIETPREPEKPKLEHYMHHIERETAEAKLSGSFVANLDGMVSV